MEYPVIQITPIPPRFCSYAPDLVISRFRVGNRIYEVSEEGYDALDMVIFQVKREAPDAVILIDDIHGLYGGRDGGRGE